MLKQCASHVPTNGLSPHTITAMPLLQFRAARELAALGIDAGSSEILLSRAKSEVMKYMELCESPIEQVMLAALGHMVVPNTDCFPPAIHNARSRDPWPTRPVVICPQFAIARYRLDFLISIHGFWIAVECDGAAHHDNPDGIARDTERDAYLSALGITTRRYTGWWIVKNSAMVADEIAAIIQEAVR